MCGLIEGEDILVGHMIVEVDNGCGVDGYTHVACLEVEVGTCGAACIAAECYGIAGLYAGVGFGEEF